MQEPTRDVQLRSMQRSDVPSVARLAAEFAQHMRDLGDVTAFCLDAAALERDGFGARPAFEGIVALHDESVVGYLLYHDGYDSDAAQRVLYVADLFVQRSARRLGVGAALMRAAARLAVARGAMQLVWTVDTRNAPAREFYEQLGGRVVESLQLMAVDSAADGLRFPRQVVC